MTTIPTPVQVGKIVQFKMDGITLEGRVKYIQGDKIEIDDDTVLPASRMSFCLGKYQPGQYCRACPGVAWCKEKR